MENLPNSLEPKLLFRRLDALFRSLDVRQSPRVLVPSFVENLFRALSDDLKASAAAVYSEHRDAFVREAVFGQCGIPFPEQVAIAQPSLRAVLRERSRVWPDPDGEDSPQRAGLLCPAPAAAMVVGERPNRSVVYFVFRSGWSRETTEFVLNTARVSLTSRLLDERIRGSLAQAAEIQRSLLVEEPPDFAGYDIACRSLPAEEVGGDFYDFTSFDDDILGLAIGDASGHGLPAALLVRDVVTGLRMGIEKDMKVGYAFRKLNRVVHRSRLTSRFVSLFYGEIEHSGNLVYVNAGHQPPILFLPSGEVELKAGGTVIGPLPEAHFKRGITRIEPGSTLLLLTDGMFERSGPGGEHFGLERIRQVVRDLEHKTAAEILDRLFEAARAWGGSLPWEDDATAVVVKREA